MLRRSIARNGRIGRKIGRNLMMCSQATDISAAIPIPIFGSTS